MNNDSSSNEKRGSSFNPFKKKEGNEGGSPKGPSFSFYWIYVIAAVLLIGYQVMRGVSPDARTITELEFKQKMLSQNDVAKLEPVKNKDIVRVYITRDKIGRAHV